MANKDTKNRLGVTDKRVPASVGTDANFKDIAAMRTRLTAINATSYSTARLDIMSTNDMVYALRLNDEAAGI